MKQTWRWSWPKDLLCNKDTLQAGVEGIVSALHHIPASEVWSPNEIAQRRREFVCLPDGSPSRLVWDVAQSSPISEDIKKPQGAWQGHIAACKQSLRNMAAAGIEVICCNFMQVLDWNRTDLAWRRPSGATCMRFNLHIPARPEDKGCDIRGSFFDDAHLGGDTDMEALVAAVLPEEARRKAKGRADWSIPYRPDHGQDIPDNIGRRAQPGNPLIGRLKALAELRGVIVGLQHAVSSQC